MENNNLMKMVKVCPYLCKHFQYTSIGLERDTLTFDLREELTFEEVQDVHTVRFAIEDYTVLW